MKTLLSAVVVALLALCAVGAAADTTPGDRKVALRIESTSLATALDKWAQQSGFQIFYDLQITQNLIAPSMSGTFTAQEALEALLAGTPLTYIWVSEKAVSVRRKPPPTVPAALQRTGREGQPSTPIAKFTSDGAAASAAGQAAARRDGASGEERSLRLEQLEEVIVTGSHIRGAAPAGSPLIVYTRKQIEASGRSSLADFVETIPQNFAGDGPDGGTLGLGNPNNVQGASGMNLRGIGTAGTLVLLNGHRLAPSVMGDFVDVSAIPLAAVERVEVLPDGASAIYGSDAVAGVVNFVLRRNYEEAETRVRNGWLASSDSQQFSASQSLGGTWAGGSLLLAASYGKSDALDASDRDYARVPLPYHIEPERDDTSLVASLSQELTERLSLQVDGLYSRSNATQLVTLDFLPTFRGTIEPEQYSGTVGFTYKLGTAWAAEGVLSLANSTYDRSTFNGFSDNAETYDADVGTAELKVDGPIWDTPAGPIALAVGIGAREEEYRSTSTLNASLGFPFANTFDRKVSIGFGELSIPLVGARNSKAWAQAINLSLAARFEDYTDAGSSLDPKVGILWRPTTALALRASYGTSFNTGRYDQTITTFNALAALDLPSDACAGGVCRTIFDVGNRTEYRPESAESFSVGFDITPTAIPDLTLSLGYYHIRYEDRIGDLPSAVEVLDDIAEFPSISVSSPSAAFVQAFLDRCAVSLNCLNLIGPFDPAGVNYYLDLRTTNLATTKTDGLDFSLAYSWRSALGEWHASLGGTHAFAFESQLTANTIPFDGIDRVGFPARTRIRGGLGFATGAFSVDAAVNHINGYDNDRVVPNEQVESWTTADLRMKLVVDAWWPGANADTIVSVQNVFDSAPPRVVDVVVPIGFDPANADARGRIVSIELVKRW
jgi:iron complex outermembrane recepter protein